ncbi:MAG TPA: glycerol kinase GlpK [Gemmatimonadales bacterium]|nr:glycerol kinase GlpK [Gemmatimonadales bacterium]
MKAILALDEGTTGGTALVVAEDGRVLGRGYREIPQHFPQPGWVEHEPEDLFQSVLHAGREAIRNSGLSTLDLAGIGITNQRETTVLWDRRTLRPVARAIVWQDRRTAERCRRLRDEGRTEWLVDKTGLVPDPYFSATKLEWLLREPALRRRAEGGELAAGTVESWIVAKLSGGRAHVSDHTNASRTLLYHLERREWDEELLQLFAIPRAVLPALVPSSGVVAEADAEWFGRALPIAGLAGDQQAALFGQGCTVPGAAKNTYGTGAFLLAFTGAARPRSAHGLLATAAVGADGRPAYALEGSVFIAGAAIQWLRDGLGIISSAAETEALARSVPDTGGVTFVPAFAGLGSPHWEPEARGSIVGLTRGSTKAHLVRAALEAMAHSSADLLGGVVGDAGRALDLLRVDGGASANDWLMQFQADVLGVPVERPDVVETTALGAAGLAGMALGVWRSAGEFQQGRRYTRFTPNWNDAERARQRAAWERALGATLNWARGGRAP